MREITQKTTFNATHALQANATETNKTSSCRVLYCTQGVYLQRLTSLIDNKQLRLPTRHRDSRCNTGKSEISLRFALKNDTLCARWSNVVSTQPS